jgi:hypothetical protein
MRAGIAELQRRVAELTAVELDSLNDEVVDEVLSKLRRRINETVESVFGRDTLEYHRYRIGPMDRTPLTLSWSPFAYERRLSICERLPYIRNGISGAISTLNFAISVLKQRLEDSSRVARVPASASSSSASVTRTKAVERSGVAP